MSNNQMITIRLDDSYIEKFDYICKVRNMNRAEVLRKFIDTQYDLYNKDSELNVMMKNMEKLASELQSYTEKLNSKE